MKQIPRDQVVARIRDENPWWKAPHEIPSALAKLRRRDYFELLHPLVTNLAVRRAILLLGPRRVGKTVLIYHIVQQLIQSGVPPSNICYLSVDHPLYNGLILSELLLYHQQAVGGTDEERGPIYVFFDEIQYHKGWEVHLKTLVDTAHGYRFVASGSAAAALKLKSNESGAGRFTDFLLPPLTFFEYLNLLGNNNLIKPPKKDLPEELSEKKIHFFEAHDIEKVNAEFIQYLNFGGYPEVIFSQAIQEDMARFVRSDIIDKVLLRDLPSLYGIQDIQELNSLFTTLAFNTANEVSLEALSKNSGVAKNTIKRYIEYLEAAFLIKKVHRIDRGGKKFQRAKAFKVYLTNPSMRSALFAPLEDDADNMGDLVETGIFSQWFHSALNALSYARWPKGEVDIVSMETGRPDWAVEVKWSDRYVTRPQDLGPLLDFCRVNNWHTALVTSKSESRVIDFNELRIQFVPASLYCYTVGFNLIHGKSQLYLPQPPLPF